MASSLNKVMIIGRLGRDAEQRVTPNGLICSTFTVAVNRTWKTVEGEPKEETEWFNIVAWNKLAEICSQYAVKGRLVYVEGRLATRSWQDQSGKTNYRTEIIASDVRFLDSRNQTDGYASNGHAQHDNELAAVGGGEELPF